MGRFSLKLNDLGLVRLSRTKRAKSGREQILHSLHPLTGGRNCDVGGERRDSSENCPHQRRCALSEQVIRKRHNRIEGRSLKFCWILATPRAVAQVPSAGSQPCPGRGRRCPGAARSTLRDTPHSASFALIALEHVARGTSHRFWLRSCSPPPRVRRSDRASTRNTDRRQRASLRSARQTVLPRTS